NDRHPAPDGAWRSRLRENTPDISLLFPFGFLFTNQKNCSGLIAGAGFSTSWGGMEKSMPPFTYQNSSKPQKGFAENKFLRIASKNY
ncbi:hypothetical protein, partial [Anaeromassilibacillus sp. An200]|uniref:hypothetical protein n=1 Tax=Anaeromassilibacillus sp. An200 TaxID=1965587 RepID=UPI000B54CF75